MFSEESNMKKTIAILFGLAGFCAPAVAQAQITIDMTKVTCAEYSAMDPVASADFSAWMSGWFNQKANDTVLNVEGFASNVANVKKWCASNPKESVMAGLTRAAQTAPTRTGGAVEIDTAMITCKQLGALDPDRRALVGSWMFGYFNSSKNLSTVDSRYVARNKKVVTGYCKKHGNVKVIEAMAKNYR
jgi:hypothetical protein